MVHLFYADHVHDIQSLLPYVLRSVYVCESGDTQAVYEDPVQLDLHRDPRP
jgi:hypothetical protein